MYYLYSIDFPNSKRYIGITDNLKRRLCAYRSHARTGSTRQKVFNTIRKYGIEDLKLTVLVIGDKEYIRDLEKKAIEVYQTRNFEFGYNQALGGEMSPVAGIGHTAESKAKMSISQKKRVHTPEEIAKMGASLKGRIMTPEHCKKLSEASLKRWADGRGYSREAMRNAGSKLREGFRPDLVPKKMRPATAALLEKVKMLRGLKMTGGEIAKELSLTTQYTNRLISYIPEED